MKSLQRSVYDLLEGSVQNKASRYCEIFIASVVVLNVLAIILESVHDLHEAYEFYFHIFDLASVVVFTAEYVLRVWSYGVKYLESEGDSWRGQNTSRHTTRRVIHILQNMYYASGRMA